MFGIMSSVIKIASREEAWGHSAFTPEEKGMMAELERRAGVARGRWRAPKHPKGRK